MRPNDLYDKLRQQPFQPFRIKLTNGSSYEIRHPELVMVGRSTALIGLPAPDLPEHFYDRSVTISLVHIVEVEPIAPASPTGSN
jgi:hypothetical protein